MRAYVISIGSELTHGQLTDTNATFLAQELIAKGIELVHVTQVADDQGRLEQTIRRALDDAEIVICTGGVGPTDDDLTREAIAAVVGETPVVDPGLVETIRTFFALRGLEMPERNAKQAWMIPSAETLPNPVGTAPGWFVRVGPRVIVAMPGVPREMYRMWREQVVPRLAPWSGDLVYHAVNVKTIGIGESAVSQVLDELTRREQPYIGTYAKDDGVHVRITAAAETGAEAEAILDDTLAEVRRRLGDYIYTEQDRSLPGALLDLLGSEGVSAAVAEAGSGGQFVTVLYSEPDADDHLRGALVLPPSEAAAGAGALARRARETFGADLGVGVTAVIAPTEQGLHEGTIHIAVDGVRTAAESFPIRAAYQEVERRAGMNACDVLRRALIGSTVVGGRP